MLNEEARRRLDQLRENVTLEIQGKDTFSILMDDIKWLADTLTWVDDRIKKHECRCMNKCAVKPEVKEVAVVHRHSDGFTLSVHYFDSPVGSVQVSICNKCHHIVETICEHKYSDWVGEEDNQKLLCKLCGADGT